MLYRITNKELLKQNGGDNMIIDIQYLKSKKKDSIIMNNGTINHTSKKGYKHEYKTTW